VESQSGISTPQPCTEYSTVIASLTWRDWTDRSGDQSATTNVPVPATWSTSTSRNLGRQRDGDGWWTLGRGSAQYAAARTASATSSCTARSTTTPVWPTPRSTLTRPPPLRRSSPPSSPRPCHTGHSGHRTSHRRPRHGYRRFRAFRDAVADIGASHRLARAYRPQDNGKAERFNRTRWPRNGPTTRSSPPANTAPTPLRDFLRRHRADATLEGPTAHHPRQERLRALHLVVEASAVV